jgi:two-component system, NarL family, response regulator
MASAAVAVIIQHSVLRTVSRRIRVLAVDGNQLVQEGLAALIDREEDMVVVATASSGEEAINDVRRYRPDVVTLDLMLPDMPGEHLARRILVESPETRILVITSAQGHLHARRALDAGVQGYLSKAVPGRELVRAIREIKAGERMIPGPMACERTDVATGKPLMARELHVLQLVARGNTNKHVAAELSIAADRVRTHMQGIIRKLGANNRTHAVAIAVSRGILRLELPFDGCTDAREGPGRTANA